MFPVLDRILLAAAQHSWRLYKGLSFNAAVDVDGQTYRIPVRDRIGLNNIKFYERQTQAALKAIYGSRSGAFIDVGANIGKILLNLIHYDRAIPYVGFEPNLTCCAYVEDLIAANGLRAHSIIPLGLSDRQEVTMLLLRSEWDVSASTVKEFRGSKMHSAEKPVCLAVGDEVLPDLVSGPIACIKIDVEGAEARVLAGLSHTIEAHRPALVIEVLPYAHLESGTYDRSYFGEIPENEISRIVQYRKETAREIGEFLSDRGYEISLIQEGGDLLPVLSLDQGERQNLHEINYLAQPTT